MGWGKTIGGLARPMLRGVEKLGFKLTLMRLFEDGPENAFAWQYPLLLKQLGDRHPAAQGQSVGRSRRNIRSIFINYLRIQVLFGKRSRY